MAKRSLSRLFAALLALPLVCSSAFAQVTTYAPGMHAGNRSVPSGHSGLPFTPKVSATGTRYKQADAGINTIPVTVVYDQSGRDLAFTAFTDSELVSLNALRKFKGEATYRRLFKAEETNGIKIMEFKPLADALQRDDACGGQIYLMLKDGKPLRWVAVGADGALKFSQDEAGFQRCTGLALSKKASAESKAPYFADSRVYKWMYNSGFTGRLGMGEYKP